MNEQNLRPPYTPKEARSYGAKGGQKSGESKRRKKTISATLDKLLSEPVKDAKQLDVIAKSGMPVGARPTYKDFLVASVIMKSIKRGNVDDLSKIIDIIGESSGVVLNDGNNEDALSRSLKEMAEDLTSD